MLPKAQAQAYLLGITRCQALLKGKQKGLSRTNISQLRIKVSKVVIAPDQELSPGPDFPGV